MSTWRVLCAILLVISSIGSSQAYALDGAQLKRNLIKQADTIKSHRRLTDPLRRIADQKVWNAYKDAELQYVKSLRSAYKYQNHPTKLTKALDGLKRDMMGYKTQAEIFLKAMNVEGATVGKTRYSPLDGFEKVHAEFKKITE